MDYPSNYHSQEQEEGNAGNEWGMNSGGEKKNLRNQGVPLGDKTS